MGTHLSLRFASYAASFFHFAFPLFHFWIYGIHAELANSLQAQGDLMKALHCLCIFLYYHSCPGETVIACCSFSQAGLGEVQRNSFYRAVSWDCSWLQKRKSEKLSNFICKFLWLVSQTEPGKKSMGLDSGLPGNSGTVIPANTDAKWALPCINLAPSIKNPTKYLCVNWPKKPYSSWSPRNIQIRLNICKTLW